jgi:hypothetical protein
MNLSLEIWMLFLAEREKRISEIAKSRLNRK